VRNQARQPEQWEIFRRLRSAGCPVDLEHLPQAWSPLLVSSGTSGWPTDLFPMPETTGILLPVIIRAHRRLVIADFALTADWLTQPVSWLGRCDQNHERCYSFHSCRYGPVRLNSEMVLNWYLPFRALSGGSRTTGLLMGSFPEILPSTAPETLEATLSIRDLAGDEYRFRLELKNIKLPENALVKAVLETKHRSSASPAASSSAPKQSLSSKVFDSAIVELDAKLEAERQAEQRAKLESERRQRKAKDIVSPKTTPQP